MLVGEYHRYLLPLIQMTWETVLLFVKAQRQQTMFSTSTPALTLRESVQRYNTTYLRTKVWESLSLCYPCSILQHARRAVGGDCVLYAQRCGTSHVRKHFSHVWRAVCPCNPAPAC